MRLALFIGALLMLVQSGAAVAQQNPSTAAQSIDREWGILAEMAGRGFGYRGMLMTVRWIEPPKVSQNYLLGRAWQLEFDFHSQSRHRRDPHERCSCYNLVGRKSYVGQSANYKSRS